ncbi:MAG: hypothetical protein ACRETQ_03835 [Gammaproteobacteria bacterium]
MTLIKGMCTELDGYLKRNYAQEIVVVDAWRRETNRRLYNSFFVWQKSWGDRWRVGVEAQHNGFVGFVYGVKKTDQKGENCGELSRRLDAKSKGKASNWWDWYQDLEPPYADWSSKDALLKMYDHSFHEELGAKLKYLLEEVDAYCMNK